MICELILVRHLTFANWTGVWLICKSWPMKTVRVICGAPSGFLRQENFRNGYASHRPQARDAYCTPSVQLRERVPVSALRRTWPHRRAAGRTVIIVVEPALIAVAGLQLGANCLINWRVQRPSGHWTWPIRTGRWIRRGAGPGNDFVLGVRRGEGERPPANIARNNQRPPHRRCQRTGRHPRPWSEGEPRCGGIRGLR